MSAFGTYVQILVEIRSIEYGLADFALAPQAFGHSLLDRARGAFYFWRQEFL
jgi:hypothetical protein